MPTPLPPVQANPDLLEMLVKLLLGTDVTDPLGPSPGFLGAMAPGAARGARAALPRIRGMAPRLPRDFRINALRVPLGGAIDEGTQQDMLDALRRFRSRLPFVSDRQVPATTPARARLANPPMSYQEGPEGPVAPSIDLGPGYPSEPPTREFSRKQLAMLEEIKVSMQKLLRAGLPAEDTPRQMLPDEMSADLAHRYMAAARRIKNFPSAMYYKNAASEARDLGDPRGSFTDATVLEDLVEEIMARFLGRLAPRQQPYPRSATQDIELGVLSSQGMTDADLYRWVRR